MQRVATSAVLGLSIIAGSLAVERPASAFVLISRASPGYSQSNGTMFCAGVAAGNVNTDGTKIIIWPCIQGAQDQQWSEVALNDVWFSLRNGANTNQCLSVAAGSVNRGAQTIIWRFYGAGNQYWRKDPSPHPGCYYLTNLGSQLVLGVAAGTMAQGTPLIQWEKLNGHVDQEWCIPTAPRRGPAN
jgi:hypothetical protein